MAHSPQHFAIRRYCRLSHLSLAPLLLFRKTLFKCQEATPPGEPYSHKKIKPAVITGQKYNSQNNIHVLLFTLFSFRLRIHQLLKPVCVKCHRLSHAAPRSHYTQHFTNKHTRGKGKQVVMSYIKLKLKPNQQRSLIKDYSKTTMNKEGILGRPSTPKTSKNLYNVEFRKLQASQNGNFHIFAFFNKKINKKWTCIHIHFLYTVYR